MEKLYNNFKSKSCLSDYNRSAIPASKKINLNINATEAQFDKNTCEKKKSQAKGNKHRAVLRKIAQEKSKVEANKDLVIAEDPEVMEADKKANVRSCWSCGSINCLIKQHISKTQGIKRQFLDSCKGMRMTIGEV